MTVDVATHLRLCAVQVDDDFVAKRTQAIAELASDFNSEDSTATSSPALAVELLDLLRPGNGARRGEWRPRIGAAIRKHAPAFVDDDTGRLQVVTCGFLAAAGALSLAPPDGSWDSTTAGLAASLASALSFQGPLPEVHLEALRKDVLQAAQSYSARNGMLARERTEVDPVEDASAVLSACESLRSNAELDREELDLLWWALNGWSDLLRKGLANASPAEAVLAAGLEMSALVARPAAPAHRELVTRHLQRARARALTFRAFGDLPVATATQFAQAFEAGRGTVDAHPVVFPLLLIVSLRARGEDIPRSLGRAGLSETVELAAEDWARRALDEANLLGMMGHRVQVSRAGY